MLLPILYFSTKCRVHPSGRWHNTVISLTHCGHLGWQERRDHAETQPCLFGNGFLSAVNNVWVCGWDHPQDHLTPEGGALPPFTQMTNVSEWIKLDFFRIQCRRHWGVFVCGLWAPGRKVQVLQHLSRGFNFNRKRPECNKKCLVAKAKRIQQS